MTGVKDWPEKQGGAVKYPKCKECENCPALRHYQQTLKAIAKWEQAHKEERKRYRHEYYQKNKYGLSGKRDTNQ